MAPLKPLNKPLPVDVKEQLPFKVKKSHTTMKKGVFPKRKAEESPLKKPTVKRSAFGDLTNATVQSTQTAGKQKAVLTATANNGVNLKKPLDLQHPLKEKPKVVVAKVPAPAPKSVKKISKIPLKNQQNVPPKPGVMTRRASARKSELETSGENSLYVSALEETSVEDGPKKSAQKVEEEKKPKRQVPPGVVDYDEEHTQELSSVAVYAMDIFEYLKTREKDFVIADYMEKQSHLNRGMRALLVDWMVEVQENFELNHETLYLAVKLVDLYLSKCVITKDILQLVGCTGLFIAAKYDERCPPVIVDFLYVCEDLYTADDLTAMEVKMLNSVNFQLGIPLSYRFLRRFSRCAKLDLPTLTLARFILEYSLMEYSTIRYSDSKMAAASLLLALMMKENGGWTPTLEYYSGYKVDDFKDIVHSLNAILHKKPKDALKTIRNKYSHKLFFEVAKIPLINDLKL